MKEDKIEYHPNGRKKHKISFHDNGNKWYQEFYDQWGNFHRESDLPDYQEWHENGRIFYISYHFHGHSHNIYNPSYIYFFENGKVWFKYYQLNDRFYSKLTWKNLIKNA